MSSSSSLSNGGRVWVKLSLVESIRNPKPQRFGRNSTNNSNNTSNNSATTTTSSNHHGSGIPMGIVRKPSFGGNSDEGSSVAASETSSRNKPWGWLPAVLLEQSSASVRIQLISDIHEDNNNNNNSNNTLQLPPTAMEDGDILLANELPLNDQGKPVPPSDLIKLAHLHEPAVVQSLHTRYKDDIIYTATGPVLLALNPFQNIRGLYGEATMKKYWDASTKTTAASQNLPPHVYQIADASFRSMMRQLDENVGATTTTPASSSDAASSSQCNQSILVSGESGAGKTVTTKFVMKYLAALSQRSIKCPTPRAYQISQEAKSNIITPKAASTRSTTPIPQWSFATPMATSSVANILQPRSSIGKVKEDRGSLPLDTSTAASNTIEAQVLQSNPILESFGNARTVRNDNSSRFGKFIEIQFTSSGKLVGANIDTYLLEKVRLVTQSHGERNYHVFFEIMEGMEASELRNYFLAKTATPHDFKMTCSGTTDRRDGIQDKETYRSLRVAMNTMNFKKKEQSDIFGTVGAILHASNLTFMEFDDDGADEECGLDFDNLHLQPVCHLLGVTPEDLNEALCHFSIQAGGGDSVRRSLSRQKAEKGLEALIKTTYGALFSYLVQRINDSVAWKKKEQDENEGENAAFMHNWDEPAATIGVLDIFGFESFTVNSFEQLCINYCNEALQQQFNAFVLKNEQEEYEREGIEWSFIEFPENQDVLDLIDKRGQGILNILDDQCRAPGTTDRSFASDVYIKCNSNSDRFSANRKQQSRHQFEIHHYAGPVEYTADGFVEKNRDELPKESLELLRNSANPFVCVLAEILEIDALPAAAPIKITEAPVNLNAFAAAPKPYKLIRGESSLSSRSTVGGQFRRQLKELRKKIDLTSPHYIRCLKPNDDLIPDQFDTAIVAEQLRCGGILEAVRVSRAGFTQHYSHADFYRRYKVLAMTKGPSSRSSSGGTMAVPKNIFGGSSGRKNSFGSSPSPRNSSGWGKNRSPKSSYGGKKWGVSSGTRSSSTSNGSFQSSKSPTAQDHTAPVNSKENCKELLKVLSKRILEFEKEETKENDGPENGETESHQKVPVTSVKAKSYQTKEPSSVPAWAKFSSKNSASGSATPLASPLPPTPTNPGPSKKKNFPSWGKQTTNSNTHPTPPPITPSYKAANRGRGGSASDLAKLGIQVGKTKVFLRHKAFEILERIRSRELTTSATKLNAIFRMYLCRVAYVPIRDAFRSEMRMQGDPFMFKEHKEEVESFLNEGGSGGGGGGALTVQTTHRWTPSSNYIPKFDSQVHASIHNPVPRNEWGKQDEVLVAFKWMLVDGLWTKNPVFVEE